MIKRTASFNKQFSIGGGPTHSVKYWPDPRYWRRINGIALFTFLRQRFYAIIGVKQFVSVAVNTATLS